MKLLIDLIILSGFVISTAFTVQAQELHKDVPQWLRSLEIDPGVTAELKEFHFKETPLPTDYVEALSAQIRQQVMNGAEKQLTHFQDGNCKPSVKVKFLKSGFFTQHLKITEDRVTREFENGFVQTEVIACFPEARKNADEALQMYTSPEFRMDVSSTIKRIEEDQGRSCVETKGIPAILRATWYCNHVQEFHQPGIASQHSQVVANPEPDDYQNIYFKESLKTFVELAEGLAFYYINYSRSDKLGKLRQSLGQNAIIRSQKSAIEELREWIKTVNSKQ